MSKAEDTGTGASSRPTAKATVAAKEGLYPNLTLGSKAARLFAILGATGGMLWALQGGFALKEARTDAAEMAAMWLIASGIVGGAVSAVIWMAVGDLMLLMRDAASDIRVLRERSER